MQFSSLAMPHRRAGCPCRRRTLKCEGGLSILADTAAVADPGRSAGVPGGFEQKETKRTKERLESSFASLSSVYARARSAGGWAFFSCVWCFSRLHPRAQWHHRRSLRARRFSPKIFYDEPEIAESL